MSRCIECRREMSDADARISLVCQRCPKGANSRVPTIDYPARIRPETVYPEDGRDPEADE